MGAEGYDVSLRDNAFVMEGDEVEDTVEGVLLPLEAVGVALGELLIRQRLPAAPEVEGKDGLAEGGDGVMEGGVVGGRVSVHHLLLWRSEFLSIGLLIKLKSFVGEKRKSFKTCCCYGGVKIQFKAWKRRSFETLPSNGTKGSRWEPCSRDGVFFFSFFYKKKKPLIRFGNQKANLPFTDRNIQEIKIEIRKSL